MIQKINKLFVFGVALLIGVGLYAGSVYAQTPAWKKTQEVDLSAFRYTIEVSPHSYAVPTVLEGPVVYESVQNKSAVVVGGQGTQPTLYTTDTEHVDMPVHVSLGHMPMTDTPRLSDGKLETTVDFPFDETGTNKVSITVTANEPITTSKLRMVLVPNVAFPHTIAIRTEATTLLAKTELEGSEVRFPKTTATTFFIEFELAQPLRLAEVEFVQESEVVRHASIRFLAQPNTNYTLFVDPDRQYGTLPLGGMSLTDDKGVVSIEGVLNANKLYTPSDEDKDGVPDMHDNCVSVSNSDQIDVDKNGRGDMCDDFDRDGIVTTKDNCPLAPNNDQRDTDGDTMGDVCDEEESRLTERSPWIPWAGMGIAAIVLVGLLFISAGMKPKTGVQVETEDKVESKD